MNTSRTLGLGLAVLAVFTMSQPASAYIDSGTGSLILQAALSGVLGGLFIARSFWANLLSRLGKARAGGRGGSHKPQA